MSKKILRVLTLSFEDPDIEKSFLEYYHRSNVGRFRWGLVLGIFLYSIFAILDSVTVGPLWPKIWFIRFALVNPFLILSFIFSYRNLFIRHYQKFASAVILVGGTGILTMLAMIPAPALHLYSQGLMLVLIFNYAFIGLRFIYASINFLLIILGFEIISLKVNPLPLHVFINNNFFLVSANFIGMAVAYYLEALNRKNYLHSFSLKKLAEYDQLTGLMNRRFFIEEVKAQLEREQTAESPAAFCILDLDGFKGINDNLGHLVGDEILINFGLAVKNKLRSTDTVGRLGGDEFGFFFPEIKSPQDILNIFSKLKEGFENVNKRINQQINFSVGCVLIDRPDMDFIECYAIADRVLLKAKQKKNRLLAVDLGEKEIIDAELQTPDGSF